MTAAVQELLTPEQAAKLISQAGVRVSRDWVLRRINEGDLPAINWSGGSGRGVRWRIDPGVLGEWLESRLAA